MNSCSKDGESVLKQAGCKAECGQCIDYIESFLLPLEEHISIGQPTIA
ncbi:hypothetical protein N9W34_06510 [Rickettsiales bacterium]|nr:hypothetical protein [Rickettsiales bacterium]